MTRHRITDLNDPAFAALFTGVRKSWYRLETLQRYDVDYERDEFAAFLRGEAPDMTPGPWQEMIAGHVAAGRILTRVHVLRVPFTDYARYELAGYPLNAQAGEDIRIIPVGPGQWPAGVARYDYWLMDEHDVWRMVYDRAGRFVHAQRCNWRLRRALASRDAALRQSMPLSEITAPLTRAS